MTGFALGFYGSVHSEHPIGAHYCQQSLAVRSPPCDSNMRTPLLGQMLPQGRQTIAKNQLLCWLLSSTTLYACCTYFVFGKDISVFLIIMAITIAPPLCLVVIQSVGETDTVPSNSISKFASPLLSSEY